MITACGGGSGSGSGSSSLAPVASTSTFPLFTVYVNTLQASSNTFSYSGEINRIPVNGSATITHGRLSAGTFEGISAQQQTKTSTGSVSGNGQTAPINTSAVFWVDSNYLPLGETGGNDYVVVNTPAVIPGTVRVNDTGTLYTLKRYSDSSKSVLRGTGAVSYVVEADTTTTALLTFIRTEKDNFNSITTITSRQMRITPAGSFTRTKDTNLTYEGTLTGTYN